MSRIASLQVNSLLLDPKAHVATLQFIDGRDSGVLFVIIHIESSYRPRYGSKIREPEPWKTGEVAPVCGEQCVSMLNCLGRDP